MGPDVASSFTLDNTKPNSCIVLELMLFVYTIDAEM